MVGVPVGAMSDLSLFPASLQSTSDCPSSTSLASFASGWLPFWTLSVSEPQAPWTTGVFVCANKRVATVPTTATISRTKPAIANQRLKVFREFISPQLGWSKLLDSRTDKDFSKKEPQLDDEAPF